MFKDQLREANMIVSEGRKTEIKAGHSSGNLAGSEDARKIVRIAETMHLKNCGTPELRHYVLWVSRYFNFRQRVISI